MFKVPLVGGTIPHEVLGHFGAGRVLLRPASRREPASSPAARFARVESAGIHDILTKCIGTSNPHNVVHATIDALQQLRSADAAAGQRGKRLDEIPGVESWPSRCA